MRVLTRALICSALFTGSASLAAAQQSDFPKGPVTMISPYTAGSSTDTFARFFAEQLTKRLKQPFLVEAIPGAGGTVGTAAMLNRAADGYTMLVANSSTNAANYSLYKSIPYKPDDFAPVACLYQAPPLISIRADLPIKTVAELVEYSKANPGKLTYGWASTTSRVGTELLKARAGVDIRPVTYKGSPQIVTDLLGGRVDVYVDTPPTILAHVESGKLRLLGTTASSRIPSLPDVPTMADMGYPDAVMAPWVAIYMKKGVPSEIVKKVNEEINAILEGPEYADVAEKGKNESFKCSPEELGRHTTTEIVRWRDFIKLAGIETQ